MKTKKQIKEEIGRLEIEREKVKGTMSEHPLNFRIATLNWVLEGEKEMTIKEALEEIKKGKKVKHKSWTSIMVSGFYKDLIYLDDDRGNPYYFELDEFERRFTDLKDNWELVSDEEYKEFCERW